MQIPERYDVVVIGAGIHGAGVAQAVAAAGHSVLVLERKGVAHGTSSRSSKLIHGGLRYLESGQITLVRESLRERAILLRVAPDLVHERRFLIPVYRDTSRPPWKIRAGLGLYAVLGGMGRVSRFGTIRQRDWPLLDGLETKDLRAVFRYTDAQTDDVALTRAVLDSAIGLGTEFRCPGEFLSAYRMAGGYEVAYDESGTPRTCFATALINAAGPWVDDVLANVTPSPPRRDIELVAGAHIVIEGRHEAGIYYLEAPQDRRAVFVMPWKGKTLIGTTERRFEGDPETVQPTAEEIDYLEATYRRYFPARPVTVVDAFAGLRVLPAGPGSLFHRPRETEFGTDDASSPHLVTLYGGKLTGYRATAAKTMALLRPVLPARNARADTSTLPLKP